MNPTSWKPCRPSPDGTWQAVFLDIEKIDTVAYKIELF
ncbi:hypothetical protein C7S13_1358 [Burkholderia cepacia]|nr:hypothetical protein [Burkholderia cepacia]